MAEERIAQVRGHKEFMEFPRRLASKQVRYMPWAALKTFEGGWMAWAKEGNDFITTSITSDLF